MLLADGKAAATTPWLGVWTLRIDGSGQTPKMLINSDAGHGAMRMVSIEDGGELVTRFDGAPAADIGTHVDRDWSLAIKAVSPTSYTWTYAKGGKPRAQGINTLAPDLRTFKQVSWEVGHPEKTRTMTYGRR